MYLNHIYCYLFIHKLVIFALTTNAIIVFILYLLTSLYLLEFIVVYILLWWNVFISLVFLLYLLNICIYFFIYLLKFIGLDIIFLYSIHVL